MQVAKGQINALGKERCEEPENAKRNTKFHGRGPRMGV